MCSTANAASGAINFLKAGVDGGVVDSLPSRGPSLTRLCFQSSLKPAVSTPLRSRSFSPALRTQTILDKKLHGSTDNDDVDPRFCDLGALVFPPVHHHRPMTMSHSRTCSGTQVPRLEENRIVLLQPCKRGVSPCYGPLSSCIVREDERQAKNSTSTRVGYL